MTTSTPPKPLEDITDRTVTGHPDRTVKSARPSKGHQEYWKAKLKRRSYRDNDGKLISIPEWQVRMFYRGQESWFNLETVNQAAAAVKARDIHLSIVSKGWASTLEAYKPQPLKRSETCSIGEFLKEVETRSHLKPMTVRRYAVKLRKIAADLGRVGEGEKRKALRAKYDYINGGRSAWLTKVGSLSMDLLTADAINNWRNEYVARAGADPIIRKSAQRSAASYLRCVRALFAADVLRALRVKLPANPFLGVKLNDPGAQRYRSAVDPRVLLAAAERDLRLAQPEEYLALNLCLWAGLRRKEADLLTWDQIDFDAGQIRIRRTAYFEPKTEDSQRDIDLPTIPMEIFRSFKAQSQSEFVLAGTDARPESTYDFYRADCTWRNLTEWLRGKGVKDRKAIHMLRKESGSLIASSFGIEAARQHLGHRDIRTTSAHYVSKKARREVNLTGAQLTVIEGHG